MCLSCTSLLFPSVSYVKSVYRITDVIVRVISGFLYCSFASAVNRPYSVCPLGIENLILRYSGARRKEKGESAAIACARLYFFILLLLLLLGTRISYRYVYGTDYIFRHCLRFFASELKEISARSPQNGYNNNNTNYYYYYY